MPRVIPAVIPESKEHLRATLEQFSSFASEAQIDITDGQFAGIASWPYTEHSLEDAVSGITLPLSVELDLMVADPLSMIELWTHLSPVRIVVHIESTENLERIFEHRKEHAYKLGLALDNDTPIERILSIDPANYDYVELMGIAAIGTQGQSFDERVLARIQNIKKAHPDMLVSVDGSVNERTLPRLRESGADRFVAGSAILKADDPAAMYKKLSALAD